MIKQMMNGALNTLRFLLLLLAICILLIGPALLMEVTDNNWWALLYLPHGLYALYVMGAE